LLLAGGEHACVLDGHRFTADAVELLRLDENGILDLADLDAALARHTGQRVMLALQAANNETGVIQPVAEAAARVHAAGGLVVCDAVQAAGKVACDINELNADIVALSAHKFGGPKGVGALCFASDKTYIEDRLLKGGGQERGLRAGTENLAAIAGFAAAAEAAAQRMPEEGLRLVTWRDQIEAELARIAPNVTIFGQLASRLPNTSCFAVPGLEAQVLLMALDVEGVSVSSGSACSSGKVKPSLVLSAMGVSAALASGAIRVSLGWNTKLEDLALFVAAFEKVVRNIRARRVRSAA
jgi:cysteine desulfurase